MLQSKNAMGSLVSRYRAVLKKCNLLNTFGSLALAAAFAMSGATGAFAAEASTNLTDWSEATDKDLTYTQAKKVIKAGNSGNGVGSLTINMENYAGSTKPVDGVWLQNANSGAFEVKGDVNIQKGMLVLHQGGNLKVSGNTTIGTETTEGVLNIINHTYSAENTNLTLNNGKILFGGADGHAGKINLGTNGNFNSIGLGEKANEINLATKGSIVAGTATFQNTNIAGGKINVGGTSGTANEIQANTVNFDGNVISKDGVEVTNSGNFTASNTGNFINNAKGLNVSGGVAVINGNMNVNENANAAAENTALTTKKLQLGASGATLVKGDVTFVDNSKIAANASSKFIVTGTLTDTVTGPYTIIDGIGHTFVGALNFNSTNGNKNLKITSSKAGFLGLGVDKAFTNAEAIEIADNGTLNLGLTQAAKITGHDVATQGGKFDGKVTISDASTGGKITVNDGTWTLKDVSVVANSNASNATINTNGNNAHLTITNATAEGKNSNNGTLKLGGANGTLTVTNLNLKDKGIAEISNSNVTVNSVNFDGGKGQLNLTDNSVLTINNEKGFNVDTANLVANGSAGDGKISFASNASTLNVKNGLTLTGNGTLTLGNNGNLTTDDLTLKTTNTALTIESGNLTATNSISAGTITANNANGHLILGGTYNADNANVANTALVANNGTINVTGANWKVKSLDVKAGSATIGDGNSLAQLTVTGAIKNAVQSTGVQVKNLGTLVIDNTKVDTQNKAFNVEAGGTLKVNGLGESVAIGDLTSLKTKYMGSSSNGLLDIGSTQVTGAVGENGMLDYTQVGGITSNTFKQNVASVANSEASAGLSGGFAGIKLEDNGTNFKVNGTLQLTGANGKPLAVGSNGKTPLNAEIDGALTLGDAELANSGGKLGNVTFNGNADVLNAINGKYTVASLGDGNNLNGVVNVAGNAQLISTGNVKVNEINVDNNSSLKAEGNNIEATTINLAGGTVIATAGKEQAKAAPLGDIKVTNVKGVGNLIADNQINVIGAITSEAEKAFNITMQGKTVDLDNTITLGASADNRLHVKADNIDLANAVTATNGSTIILDGLTNLSNANSNITAGNATDEAVSKVYIQALDGNSTNGNLSALANGVLSVGYGLENIDAQVAFAESAAQAKYGDNTFKYNAVLALSGKNIDASKHGISVGSDATANNVNVGANGLLIADVKDFSNDSVLIDGKDTATVTIADKAGVHLVDAKAGQDYTLVANMNTNSTISDNANFTTNNILVNITGINTENNNLVVSTDLKNISTVFPMLDGALHGILANASTKNVGQNAFLVRALDVQSTGLNETQTAAAIEGAAKAAFVAGAPQQAISIATGAANFANARTSFAPQVAGAVAMNDKGEAVNISAGDNMANGANIWVMPMYQNTSASGFKSGNFSTGFDSDFAGVVVGGDYTWDNSLRLGVAFNMGSGSSDSTGDFFKTENDFDSVGVSLYGGYQFGNLGLSADLGFTNINNDIKQQNPVMALNGEFDTNTTTFGVKAEYQMQAGGFNLVPYLGMRYTYIDMDNLTLNGVIDARSADATVWQFPIGVAISKDFSTASGWNIAPSLDLSIIPVVGDKEMAQSVSFTGVEGVATMESEIMDGISGRVGLGVEATKGNIYMGLDYAYQGSSNMDVHGVQANIGFKF